MGAVFSPDRLSVFQMDIVQGAQLHALTAADAGIRCPEGIRFYKEAIEHRVHRAAHKAVVEVLSRRGKFLPGLEPGQHLLKRRLCLLHDALCLLLLGCIEHGNVVFRHDDLRSPHIMQIFLRRELPVVFCRIADLAAAVNHPNAGGVLVLGLGCENSNIDELKKHIGDYDERRVRFLVAQESEDEIADALEIIKELADQVCQYKREPIPASELIIGMKCGGSDGLSGITANPTVGGFSDLLISKGGTTILTEVPEMFGAETLLMNRCETEELFDETVNLVNDFKNYFKSHNQTIYENPSPGNKKGGISTLEDKSLGCTQKSGSAPVKGVLSYGEPVKVHGLNLLSAPGNDLVASTALAASGAHIVLFTTGRGTPFASPVPTVKISSNSALANKKSNWIDFNCGVLVEDGTPAELSKDLFDFVIDIASGKKSKSEEAGFHDMAIFKQGVTL